MEKKTLRRFDLVTSIVLILGSIFYIIECIKLFFNPMGRPNGVSPEELAKIYERWFESPALLPFIIGFLILICSVILLFVAIKDGARFDFFKKEKMIALKKNKEFVTFLIVAAMLAIYIYVLIPLCRLAFSFVRGFQGFPFAIATFIYITATAILFQPKSKVEFKEMTEEEKSAMLKKKKKGILVSIIVGLVASFVISFAFNKGAMIPLP